MASNFLTLRSVMLQNKTDTSIGSHIVENPLISVGCATHGSVDCKELVPWQAVPEFEDSGQSDRAIHHITQRNDRL